MVPFWPMMSCLKRWKIGKPGLGCVKFEFISFSIFHGIVGDNLSNPSNIGCIFHLFKLRTITIPDFFHWISLRNTVKDTWDPINHWIFTNCLRPTGAGKKSTIHSTGAWLHLRASDPHWEAFFTPWICPESDRSESNQPNFRYVQLFSQYEWDHSTLNTIITTKMMCW